MSADELSRMASNGLEFAKATFEMRQQISLIERHMLDLLGSSS
jgi:hypothetical protein